MIEMYECKLNYLTHLEKMKTGECNEYERLKDGCEENKHAIFFKTGGIVRCFGRNCPYRKREPLKVSIQRVEQTISLNEKEKKYLKRIGLGWLDEKYVIKNGFYAYTEDGEGWAYFRDNLNLPVRSRDIIKAGDVIIFFEYDGFDRFCVIDACHIKEYKERRASLIPNGIVVPCPENKKAV